MQRCDWKLDQTKQEKCIWVRWMRVAKNREQWMCVPGVDGEWWRIYYMKSQSILKVYLKKNISKRLFQNNFNGVI